MLSLSVSVSSLTSLHLVLVGLVFFLALQVQKLVLCCLYPEQILLLFLNPQMASFFWNERALSRQPLLTTHCRLGGCWCSAAHQPDTGCQHTAPLSAASVQLHLCCVHSHSLCSCRMLFVASPSPPPPHLPVLDLLLSASLSVSAGATAQGPSGRTRQQCHSPQLKASALHGNPTRSQCRMELSRSHLSK